MKSSVLISAYIFLIFAIVFFFGKLFYEHREGDYPYIYNGKNNVNKYYFLYIDGSRINVITHIDSPGDSEGEIIDGMDDVHNDISQDCNFILGKYDSLYGGKDRKTHYFLIDKRYNKVYLNMNRAQLNDEVGKRNLAISVDTDNTRRLSDRKRLYAECDHLENQVVH